MYPHNTSLVIAYGKQEHTSVEWKRLSGLSARPKISTIHTIKQRLQGLTYVVVKNTKPKKK